MCAAAAALTACRGACAQVREADRKAKAAREAKENARREEERKKEEVERAVKAAEEKREAAAKEYEERSAKRAEQLPFLQPAFDAVDELVSSLDRGDEAVEAALSQESVKKFTEGVDIKKIIYVPGKILNIVAPPAKK